LRDFIIKKIIIIVQVLFVLVSVSAQAKGFDDIICSYAPSSSKVVGSLSSAAGGVGTTTLAITKATGLTAVMHSSGAYIFTGSSGYVAGTIGGAATVPIVVGVGLAAGATAGTVELLCVPKNHPEFTAKVKKASKKFDRKLKKNVKYSSNKTMKAKVKIKHVASKVSVVMKGSAKKVFKYVWRKARH
jgi:hypothetical protein